MLAARAAGADVREFVHRNAEAFLALGPALALTVDDIIRTSCDVRHRPGVERVWRACAAAGDLYRKRYEGLYCTGCEQFYTPAELRDGCCPEHETAPQPVAEQNWFFRLSRYARPLRDAIASGGLRIEPAGRRHEVLAFIDRGLQDFSVSRPAERAGSWGIPVPGDPGQVIYVWFDALCNYVTALGYGTDDDAYRQWWAGSAPGSRRIHLLGKGVLRAGLSVRRWRSTTSTRPRRRSGPSRTRPTGSSTRPGRGSWPGPNATATPGPASGWMPCSASCSRAAGRSAASWSRSCQTRPSASAASPRPGMAGFLRPPRCSGGCRPGTGRASTVSSGGGRHQSGIVPDPDSSRSSGVRKRGVTLVPGPIHSPSR